MCRAAPCGVPGPNNHPLLKRHDAQRADGYLDTSRSISILTYRVYGTHTLHLSCSKFTIRRNGALLSLYHVVFTMDTSLPAFNIGPVCAI